MAKNTSKKVLSLAMGAEAGRSSLAKQAGQMIFVTDTGKMYIDVTDDSRVLLNAGTADSATTASGADKLNIARTLTVGSTGKSFDGTSAVSWSHSEIGATVSNAWIAGTSAGPKIATTVNGVTGTAVAIPSASASASGVVTTGAQTFAGTKTFSSTIQGSISGNAGGTAAGWTTPRTFTINGAASNDGVSVDGKGAVALNIPTKLTGFTSITSDEFVGALTGNATTATTASKVANTLTIQGNGTTLYTFDGSSAVTANITPANIGALSTSTTYAGSKTVGGAANSVANSLTIGGKTYNGSSAVSITLSDLGLANALHFLGTTTTSLSDGSNTTSITVDSTTHTMSSSTAGNVVLYNNKEFVWTGSAWEELGDESSHALKTISITGTGALGGGGTLAANRTITHNTYNSAGKTVGTSTTSISGSAASGTLYIPKITVDTYGHITYNTDTAVSIKMPTLPSIYNLTLATSTEEAPAATTSVTFDPDSATKTFTIYKMKGATTLAAGYQGLVPAPAALETDAADTTIYTALLGDGTWGEPSITWGTF